MPFECLNTHQIVEKIRALFNKLEAEGFFSDGDPFKRAFKAIEFDKEHQSDPKNPLYRPLSAEEQEFIAELDEICKEFGLDIYSTNDHIIIYSYLQESFPGIHKLLSASPSEIAAMHLFEDDYTLPNIRKIRSKEQATRIDPQDFSFVNPGVLRRTSPVGFIKYLFDWSRVPIMEKESILIHHLLLDYLMHLPLIIKKGFSKDNYLQPIAFSAHVHGYNPFSQKSMIYLYRSVLEIEKSHEFHLSFYAELKRLRKQVEQDTKTLHAFQGSFGGYFGLYYQIKRDTEILNLMELYNQALLAHNPSFNPE